jgi:hypothetical protein
VTSWKVVCKHVAGGILFIYMGNSPGFKNLLTICQVFLGAQEVAPQLTVLLNFTPPQVSGPHACASGRF